MGYSNQQTLIASCVGVNAIASGTWMNVRAFPPEKFDEEYENEKKSHHPWYYLPQAFSEYRVQSMDVAQRLGVLMEMIIPPMFNSSFAAMLFAGTEPSDVGLSETKTAYKRFSEETEELERLFAFEKRI